MEKKDWYQYIHEERNAKRSYLKFNCISALLPYDFWTAERAQKIGSYRYRWADTWADVLILLSKNLKTRR